MCLCVLRVGMRSMRVKGLWEREWPTSDERQKYCTPRVNKDVAFYFFKLCRCLLDPLCQLQGPESSPAQIEGADF